MMTQTQTMTARIPSAFGMPAYGCALRTAVIAVAPTSIVAQENSAPRVRKAGVATDLGLGRGSFPGTTAWRPPIT